MSARMDSHVLIEFPKPLKRGRNVTRGPCASVTPFPKSDPDVLLAELMSLGWGRGDQQRKHSQTRVSADELFTVEGLRQRIAEKKCELRAEAYAMLDRVGRR